MCFEGFCDEMPRARPFRDRDLNAFFEYRAEQWRRGIEDDFQFVEWNLVLTAHLSDDAQDHVAIALTSVAGEQKLQQPLRVHKTISIADLCHMVAVRFSLISSSVRVVLPDGRALNDMTGTASVATLLNRREV